MNLQTEPPMPSKIESRESQEPSTPLKAVQHRVDGYRELFQNKRFVALWIGQIFSQLADRIIFVLFIAQIVEHFGTQGMYKSFLYVAFTIPAILLTAVAGVFIDRTRNQHVLIASNLLRAGILAGIGIITASNSLLAIYAAAFMVSVATQFFAPAESASIPTIVPKQQLLVANSLFTSTMMASLVFGFALGDPLIMWLGINQVHWAIVGLFLLSSIALCFVRTPKPIPQSKISAVTFVGIIEDLADGFQYLIKQPELLNRMLKLTILFSYVVAMSILFISYAESYIYDDPLIATRKFAWLITASGIGMLLGSLVIGNSLRQVRKQVLVFTGFLMTALSLLVLMATPLIPKIQIAALMEIIPLSTWRGVFAHGMSLLMGFSAAFVAIPLQSMVHEMLPESNSGRVMGIQFTLLSTASTLPAIIAGFGADSVGVLPMFLMMSIPLFIISARSFMKWTTAKGQLDAATDW